MAIRIMIRIEAVEHYYGSGKPIAFKDWQIANGEHWLMLGNSGSGKTTLLHILSGLLKPSSGHVFMDKQDIYQLPARKLDKLRGAHIGMVLQRAHLIKSLTVKENLLVAQRLAGFDADLERIREVVTKLGLTDHLDKHPYQLSQGQQQRVSIARAVVNKPRLLVADEPTSSLDDDNTNAVLDLLIQQADDNGATLLISTHDKRVKTKFDKQYHI